MRMGQYTPCIVSNYYVCKQAMHREPVKIRVLSSKDQTKRIENCKVSRFFDVLPLHAVIEEAFANILDVDDTQKDREG